MSGWSQRRATTGPRTESHDGFPSWALARSWRATIVGRRAFERGGEEVGGAGRVVGGGAGTAAVAAAVVVGVEQPVGAHAALALDLPGGGSARRHSRAPPSNPPLGLRRPRQNRRNCWPERSAQRDPRVLHVPHAPPGPAPPKCGRGRSVTRWAVWAGRQPSESHGVNLGARESAHPSQSLPLPAGCQWTASYSKPPTHCPQLPLLSLPAHPVP